MYCYTPKRKYKQEPNRDYQRLVLVTFNNLFPKDISNNLLTRLLNIWLVFYHKINFFERALRGLLSHLSRNYISWFISPYHHHQQTTTKIKRKKISLDDLVPTIITFFFSYFLLSFFIFEEIPLQKQM